jgi:hypothetical protein
MTRSLPLSLLVAVATAAALLPAAAANAQSAPVRSLHLTARADAAAPADRTPKVVFTLHNGVRLREYGVELKQTSGQKATNEQGYNLFCSPVISRNDDFVATSAHLRMQPLPLGSYTLPGNQPCTGMYDGELTTPRRGFDRVLQTFRFRVPEMKITSVRIVKG